MLHRVLASLVCVLGAAALALGIASATVWRPSDTLVAEATAGPGSTLLVTEPGVLTMAAPDVTVTVTGEDVVIVLGRTADVEAWVGRDAHTTVTGLADWHVLATNDVAARPDSTGDAEEPAAPDGEGATEEPTEPAEEAAPPAEGEAAEEAAPPAEGEAAEGEAADAEETPAPPDPSGSDMWWAEVSGSTSAELEWTETDGRWSVLAAATAVGADAPQIALTWPQEVVTPWLWPGVFVGSLLLMIGLAWWALILVAGRRHARAASRAESVPEAPVLVPAAPLTRRQLREAAAAQEHHRARRSQERDSIVDRFPMLVPAPRKVTPPSKAEVVPAATPAGVAVAGDPVSPDPVAAVASDPAAAEPQAGRRSRRRFALPGSRGRDARQARSAPEAGADRAAAQQPPPLSPAGAPPSSADAWRRTWGLPDSDEGSPTDGEQR